MGNALHLKDQFVYYSLACLEPSIMILVSSMNKYAMIPKQQQVGTTI